MANTALSLDDILINQQASGNGKVSDTASPTKAMLMNALMKQTYLRSNDLGDVSSTALKRAGKNLDALPDQQNLWNNSTAYAQQAAAQQAAPGRAFGYDPQQAAFMETLFNPMNPETNGRMGTRPNAMAGLTQQALAAQSLADRKAKGAGTMAALSLDQLDQSNRVSNSPLAQIAASPELMKLYPYMNTLNQQQQLEFVRNAQPILDATAPNNKAAVWGNLLQSSQDTMLTDNNSLVKSMLPGQVYSSGTIPNKLRVPLSIGSTVATEVPKLNAALENASQLPNTVARLNSMNSAWQGVKNLPAGVTTNSPLTGAMSTVIDGLVPGISNLFGTKINAGDLESLQQKLIASGTPPDIAQSAVYRDKDGTLVMNNDAMRASVATSKKGLWQSVTGQAAGGFLGDYQQSLLKGGQNDQVADTPSYLRKVQDITQGSLGKLTMQKGIGLNGKPSQTPEDAITDVIVVQNKDGTKTIKPIIQILNQGSMRTQGNLDDFISSVEDFAKDKNTLTAAEAAKWATTAEGKAAFKQMQINNGMVPDSSAPPADATGQKKIQPNSWIDNMLNAK